MWNIEVTLSVQIITMKKLDLLKCDIPEMRSSLLDLELCVILLLCVIEILGEGPEGKRNIEKTMKYKI